jgi:hypothetical protein
VIFFFCCAFLEDLWDNGGSDLMETKCPLLKSGKLAGD